MCVLTNPLPIHSSLCRELEPARLASPQLSISIPEEQIPASMLKSRGLECGKQKATQLLQNHTALCSSRQSRHRTHFLSCLPILVNNNYLIAAKGGHFIQGKRGRPINGVPQSCGFFNTRDLLQPLKRGQLTFRQISDQ